VRGARESRGQVLPNVAAEESGHPVTAVLPHVRELVRQERGRGGGAVGDRAVGGRSEEDASPEDDRVRARDRRQDACEATAVKSGAEELVLERGEEAVGEGNRKRSARQLRPEERSAK
jgi:hypothetical protein